MKIQNVKANRKRKSIEIQTSKGSFSLPFTKLRVKPTSTDPIQHIFVDKELAGRAITYQTQSGQEDSIHLDAFLDYNEDPSLMREIVLHQLTIKALSAMKNGGLANNEILRRLKTSPSQLHRLIDPSNSKKSVDEMLRLLSVLGFDVELRFKKKAA